MIWFKRLDGGKNNVGLAIRHPCEWNLEEQVPPMKILTQEFLLGV